MDEGSIRTKLLCRENLGSTTETTDISQAVFAHEVRKKGVVYLALQFISDIDTLVQEKLIILVEKLSQ